VGAAIAATTVGKKTVMRGTVRRAEAVRPTDPQRDRIIIQPGNKLKENDKQRACRRCDPSNRMPAF